VSVFYIPFIVFAAVLAAPLIAEVVHRFRRPSRFCSYPGCLEPRQEWVERYMHFTSGTVWRTHPHTGGPNVSARADAEQKPWEH
jgi:hypothetical protein